eukprot:9470189-Pyramimonas_sp.AAC.1
MKPCIVCVCGLAALQPTLFEHHATVPDRLQRCRLWLYVHPRAPDGLILPSGHCTPPPPPLSTLSTL